MTYTVRSTPKIDTRQGLLPSREELLKGTQIHIDDVIGIYALLCNIGYSQVLQHDYTKKANFDLFYLNFEDTINKGSSFKEGKWWKIHRTDERHHCLDYLGKEPLNLLDIIEMIIDWYAAGKARGGIMVKPHFSSNQMQGLLLKAFNNTLDLVDKLTVVE